MNTAAPIDWIAEPQLKRAVSSCGHYIVTWADHPTEGRYFNAWFGESPRKHLTGTFDKDLAKTVCDQHRRKHQPKREAA